MTTKNANEPDEWCIDLNRLPFKVVNRRASLLDEQVIERLPPPILEALGRVIHGALGWAINERDEPPQVVEISVERRCEACQLLLSPHCQQTGSCR